MAQGPTILVMALPCAWMVPGGQSSSKIFYSVQELIPSPGVGVNAPLGPGARA